MFRENLNKHRLKNNLRNSISNLQYMAMYCKIYKDVVRK